MYQLELDYPNMPKGQELSIPGLGTYQNGSTTVISKEEADSFRQYQVDNGMPDRTLLQAFTGAEYVTVTTVSEKPGQGQKKKEGDE